MLVELHQQIDRAAVRSVVAVAFDRHRHTPLVHSLATVATAARLIWFPSIRCVPVESVVLCPIICLSYNML